MRKVIAAVEDKHKASAGDYFADIWDRVVYRTSNSTIVIRLKSEGEPLATASFGVVMGNQTEAIVAHYRALQEKAEEYLTGVMRFESGETDGPINFEKLELVRRLINQLIDAKVVQEVVRW